MDISQRLQDIEHNLRAHGALGVRRWTALPEDAMPGLEQLLGSLTVISPSKRQVRERHVEDWNPLAQRVLLSDRATLPMSELELPLGTLSSHAQTFVEWAHEAVHIYSMEGWLTGAHALTDRESFRSWYLAGEGLAYWYADIVVTRALRQALPSLNLVFSRQAVSSASFHPETALAELGLTSPEDVLPVYLEAFTGRWEHQGPERLGRAFSARVRDFYEDSAGTLGNLFQTLSDYDILDGYWRRFCAIPGLPSLLDESQRRDLGALTAVPAHRLLAHSLATLSRLDEQHLAAVRLRRSLQLRAYYLWMLLATLEGGQVYGLEPSASDEAGRALRPLLDDLAQGLQSLAAGAALTEVQQVADRVSASVDAVIAGPLAGSIMAYRYWIFPAFAPTGGLMGLWTERSAFSDEEAARIASDVFERSTRSEEVILLMSDFLRTLRSGQAERVVAFNRLMLHRDVRPTWTIDLGEISFQSDRFRELAFEFR